MIHRRDRYKRMAQFVASLFPENGAVYLCCMSSKTGAVSRLFSAQKDQACDFLENKFRCFKRNDYYVSKNTFKGSSRNADQLYGFTNIVIDIDDHGPFAQKVMTAEIQDLMHEIEAAYTGESITTVLPKPSHILFTGRGIQVWYSFDSIAASNTYVYHQVQEHLISCFESICKTLTEKRPYFNMEVDGAASRNDAGVYRLPETYNTKTEELTSILYSSGIRYDFWGKEGLSSVCHADGFKKPVPTIKKEKKKALPRLKATGAPVCEMLERLVSLRSYNEYPAEGMRDLFCYVYFNAALQVYGKEKAFVLVKQFNKMFCDSFSETELMQHIRHIARKISIHRITKQKITGYFHSNRYIIGILDISPAEQESLQFFAQKVTSSASPALPKKRKKDKRIKIRNTRVQDRNRARLLHRKYPGMSMREIAYYCGYTRQWANQHAKTPFEGEDRNLSYEEGTIKKKGPNGVQIEAHETIGLAGDGNRGTEQLLRVKRIEAKRRRRRPELFANPTGCFATISI